MSPRCERCDKPTGICVCDRVRPREIQTRVLVLQHPEEPDSVLGTARLLELALPSQVRVVVGQTWGSLADAWGEPAGARGEPQGNEGWAVLWRGQLPRALSPEEDAAAWLSLDRAGRPSSAPWHGVVVLDGTWSQARTLWWRNPWLLRLGRILLRPSEASIYGTVRREPRREAVSTLEAVAEVLARNGDGDEVRAELRALMRTMVQRARDTAPPGLGKRR